MAYCSNCGTQIPDGAAFCPKCGMEIGVMKNDGGSPGNVQNWDQDRHMRRHIRRQMRRDAWGFYSSPVYRLLGAVTGGLIVILLGGLLFAASQSSYGITWSSFWAYLLVGVGVILLFRFFVVLLIPGHRYDHNGNLIGGVILIALGGIFIFRWSNSFWPLIIVAAGILVIAVGILNFLTRRPV